MGKISLTQHFATWNLFQGISKAKSICKYVNVIYIKRLKEYIPKCYIYTFINKKTKIMRYSNPETKKDWKEPLHKSITLLKLYMDKVNTKFSSLNLEHFTYI